LAPKGVCVVDAGAPNGDCVVDAGAPNGVCVVDAGAPNGDWTVLAVGAPNTDVEDCVALDEAPKENPALGAAAVLVPESV
jgi:hypothetical protein